MKRDRHLASWSQTSFEGNKHFASKASNGCVGNSGATHFNGEKKVVPSLDSGSYQMLRMTSVWLYVHGPFSLLMPIFFAK